MYSLIVQQLTRFKLARPRRAVPQRQLGFLSGTGQPQAFWSKSWQISFCKVIFCAKSIFVVCQAVSSVVLLLAAKIQDGRRFIGLMTYLLLGMTKRHS